MYAPMLVLRDDLDTEYTKLKAIKAIFDLTRLVPRKDWEQITKYKYMYQSNSGGGEGQIIMRLSLIRGLAH